MKKWKKYNSHNNKEGKKVNIHIKWHLFKSFKLDAFSLCTFESQDMHTHCMSLEVNRLGILFVWNPF